MERGSLLGEVALKRLFDALQCLDEQQQSYAPTSITFPDGTQDNIQLCPGAQFRIGQAAHTLRFML